MQNTIAPFVGLALGEQDMIRDIARRIETTDPKFNLDHLPTHYLITRLGGHPNRRATVAAHVRDIIEFDREVSNWN